MTAEKINSLNTAGYKAIHCYEILVGILEKRDDQD
jgi:hypothetical protein